MKNQRKALNDLNEELRKEISHKPIQFNKFLNLAAEKPKLIFRNVFQLFYDMVNFYVPKGIDERENIGLINYDFSQLLTHEVEDPFFADVLFSNRLMCLTEGFKKGLQSNKIVLFEGPPGSGKSIFLNNLVSKFEEFTKRPEGTAYETLWRLDTKLFKGLEHKIDNLSYLDVPCPNHDHPIFQIPKAHRKKFLDELIEDKEFKHELFKKKEYEWLFKGSACSICTSIYRKLSETEDPKKAFEMLYAIHYKFDRQLGEGVSIFNSTDPVTKKPHENKFLQEKLNELLGGSNVVQYVFSDFAKTNNGIFALMDIKENNCQRLKDLYGIASDEIHKVANIEEHINSLFIGLINPEDTKQYQDFPSFKDRITTVKVPYVMDYNTEIGIYQSKFSGDLKSHFLPRVLESFSKLIISSRLKQSSDVLDEWIGNTKKYEQYLDKNGLLLKIELYSGQVPTWLSEEDRKKFTPKVRKKLIRESQEEGFEGFSGRQSIEVLNFFLLSYLKKGEPITMKMLSSFFEHNPSIHKRVPGGFLDSMINMYDFEVLQEVKESLYNYNEKRISRDVQNYLFAINFELGNKGKCIYTGDIIEITDEYFKGIEDILIGNAFSQTSREVFRGGVQKTYVSKTLATEINVENKPITKTEQYKHLFEKYSHNIKENVLLPLIVNDNFRRAIQDYGTVTFDSYDKRLQQDVSLLIKNLHKKFNYTEECAKQVCIYVLDKNLTEKFGKKNEPEKKKKKRSTRPNFGGIFT